MGPKVQFGSGLIGLLFLGLGLYKFAKGDDWVVWIILGVLFGGVTAAKMLMKGSDQP